LIGVKCLKLNNMIKLLDIILRKKSDIVYNTYYFSNYMPVVMSWEDKVAISRNMVDRSFKIETRIDGVIDVVELSFDKLIQVKDAKVLAITNNKHYKLIDIFKVGDVLSIGKIESFPIVDKILMVRINGINRELEVLDNEIPSIINTCDAGGIYDFNDEVYKLNLEKLNYELVKISENMYEGVLSDYFNPNNIYKFFKSREMLNLFVKDYISNSNQGI